MDKLPKRFHNYLKHSVRFRCKLSPPPKSSSELKFVLNVLEKLATVDILRSTSLTPLDPKKLLESGFWIDILYSPCYPKSIFSPMLPKGDFPPLSKESIAKNKLAQSNFIEKLNSLVAIPRFHALETDTEYIENQRGIKLVHQLVPSAMSYRGNYELTTSTIDNPLISIKRKEPLVNEHVLRASMRHNFQLFHKFESIAIYKNGLFNLVEMN
ncbi:hypothetical protein KGF56_000920 [Candida oxycetoniae]|uniref:Uncharacterized protein n=1 Tax=Candida oxycetoniae TaxID=497107 RepID=A0AAI9T0N6_9ASCO|nr:uncharacterized protein KGF56_000920 [Candida oxycetoniae]KAI3406439.2 hypothetical protein KGF56_000920 [Candida oxycetoniae]